MKDSTVVVTLYCNDDKCNEFGTSQMELIGWDEDDEQRDEVRPDVICHLFKCKDCGAEVTVNQTRFWEGDDPRKEFGRTEDSLVAQSTLTRWGSLQDALVEALNNA